MLTDIAIKAALRNAKAAGKPQKRYDEKGLYLLVKPSGAALWRFKYVFGVKKATTGKRKGQLVGIEKGIGLGAYADVPLKRARGKRDDARKLVADGIDPSAVRKAQRVHSGFAWSPFGTVTTQGWVVHFIPGVLRKLDIQAILT
jgi:hypothetical protein